MQFVLEREQVVPRARDGVFAFFADARNLERLTPSTLSFAISTPTPIEMRAGALIDYRIKLGVVPLRWRTLIEVFEPPARFVDVQLAGPYKKWRHTHEFAEVDGGTAIRDRVEYELPFGPLGLLARTPVRAPAARGDLRVPPRDHRDDVRAAGKWIEHRFRAPGR
jgi:ligand-binding SRPBCC domain-containing protein